jgi:hypothetical protein
VPIRIEDQKNVTILDLEENNLRFLDTHSFSYTVVLRLTSIYLGKNLIAHIQEGTFSRLSYLRLLDLKENKITNITRGTFDNLTNLKVLDLSANPLSQVSWDTFSSLTALRYLSFDDTQITSIGFKSANRKHHLSVSAGGIRDLGIISSNLSHSIAAGDVSLTVSPNTRLGCECKNGMYRQCSWAVSLAFRFRSYLTGCGQDTTYFWNRPDTDENNEFNWESFVDLRPNSDDNVKDNFDHRHHTWIIPIIGIICVAIIVGFVGVCYEKTKTIEKKKKQRNVVDKIRV